MMNLVKAAASLAPWKLATVVLVSLGITNRVPMLRQIAKMS